MRGEGQWSEGFFGYVRLEAVFQQAAKRGCSNVAR
jgi:hypothetical protein